MTLLKWIAAAIVIGPPGTAIEPRKAHELDVQLDMEVVATLRVVPYADGAVVTVGDDGSSLIASGGDVMVDVRFDRAVTAAWRSVDEIIDHDEAMWFASDPPGDLHVSSDDLDVYEDYVVNYTGEPISADIKYFAEPTSRIEWNWDGPTGSSGEMRLDITSIPEPMSFGLLCCLSVWVAVIMWLMALGRAAGKKPEGRA